MKKAASDLNFEEAIRLRDEIAKVKEIWKKQQKQI
jgi:excinuclease ABC subunit B